MVLDKKSPPLSEAEGDKNVCCFKNAFYLETLPEASPFIRFSTSATVI